MVNLEKQPRNAAKTTGVCWLLVLVVFFGSGVRSGELVVSSLSGIYTAQTLITATSNTDQFNPKPAALPLELKLELTDDGGLLSGDLRVKTNQAVFEPSFPIQGIRNNQQLKLKLRMLLCLEQPLIDIPARVTKDNAIEIPKLKLEISCNLSSLTVALPNSVRLIR